LDKYSKNMAIVCSNKDGWKPTLASAPFTMTRDPTGETWTSKATLKWNNADKALTGSDRESVKYHVEASVIRRKPDRDGTKVVYKATSDGELVGNHHAAASKSSKENNVLAAEVNPVDDLKALESLIPDSSDEDHLKRMVVYRIKATNPCGAVSPLNDEFQIAYKCKDNGRWYNLRTE